MIEAVEHQSVPSGSVDIPSIAVQNISFGSVVRSEIWEQPAHVSWFHLFFLLLGLMAFPHVQGMKVNRDQRKAC